MRFFIDLFFALVGMVVGTFLGFVGFLILFPWEIDPIFRFALAAVSAIVFAGVVGICGANARSWFAFFVGASKGLS